MILFRIGCYVLIATCFIHLVGLFQEFTPANETERQLIDLMTNYKVVFGSFSFTMGSLQEGFSLCFSLLFLWAGGLSLVLSYQLAGQQRILFNVGIINTVALVMGTTISIIYFFPPPTICFAIALAFFALSLFKLRSK